MIRSNDHPLTHASQLMFKYRTCCSPVKLIGALNNQCLDPFLDPGSHFETQLWPFFNFGLGIVIGCEPVPPMLIG